LKEFAVKKLPSGYKAKVAESTGTTPAAGSISDVVKDATYGNTAYIDVVAAATSKIEFFVESVTNVVDGKNVALNNPLTNGKISSSDISINLSVGNIALLSGDKGVKFDSNKLETLGTALKGTDSVSETDSSKVVKGSKTYKDSTNKLYHYEFSLNTNNFSADNRNKTYGDNLVVNYTATLKTGAGSATTNDTSWFA